MHWRLRFCMPNVIVCIPFSNGNQSWGRESVEYDLPTSSSSSCKSNLVKCCMSNEHRHSSISIQVNAECSCTYIHAYIYIEREWNRIPVLWWFIIIIIFHESITIHSKHINSIWLKFSSIYLMPLPLWLCSG